MNKKSRLGRGLSELIPALSEKEAFQKIPVESIVFSSLQPRITFKEDEEFRELLASIEKEGLLQPILVRPLGNGLYECVAGERRLRAVKKLGWKEVPAIVKELDDRSALLIALIENLQRKDLNPIETALAYQSLMEKFGFTQEEVAERVGKDRATVANLVRILKLPEEVKQDLLEGRLSVGHAKALLSLQDVDNILQVRELILKKGLSVRQTEELVRKVLEGKPQKKERRIDPDLAYLSEELSKLLGTKVEVKKKRKKTVFVLEFDELERAEEFINLLKKSLPSA
jgi:ParB family chromosome partitioning protein